MKLLRIIRSLHPSSGGPIEGLKQCTPFLDNHHISTSVACLDKPLSPWLDHLPFDVYPLGPVIGSYGFKSQLISSIQELCSEFDAVIIEGLWQYHALATWYALKSLHIPYFVFVHGMLDPWFKESYPLKHIKKSIYWYFAEYKVLRDAEAVLFTTDVERQRARLSFQPYSVNEKVVGYGASPPPVVTRSELNSFFNQYPALRDKEIYLFLGRLHPKKGVELLIAAFASIAFGHPERHLVLAGPTDSSYRLYLEAQIRALSLASQVTWTGHLSAGLKWAAYTAAHLFCLPSHQENFGVSVVEALSVGLPVAISNPVNISDHILASGAGLVYPDTVIGTTAALQQWISLSQSQRDHMSQSALSLFHAEFDWTYVSSRLADVISQP